MFSEIVISSEWTAMAVGGCMGQIPWLIILMIFWRKDKIKEAAEKVTRLEILKIKETDHDGSTGD